MPPLGCAIGHAEASCTYGEAAQVVDTFGVVLAATGGVNESRARTALALDMVLGSPGVGEGRVERCNDSRSNVMVSA